MDNNEKIFKLHKALDIKNFSIKKALNGEYDKTRFFYVKVSEKFKKSDINVRNNENIKTYKYIK